jgi:hypothetical protein
MTSTQLLAQDFAQPLKTGLYIKIRRLQTAGRDLGLAADKGRENANDVSFMQMTVLRGEDAVD